MERLELVFKIMTLPPGFKFFKNTSGNILMCLPGVDGRRDSYVFYILAKVEGKQYRYGSEIDANFDPAQIPNVVDFCLEKFREDLAKVVLVKNEEAVQESALLQ